MATVAPVPEGGPTLACGAELCETPCWVGVNTGFETKMAQLFRGRTDNDPRSQLERELQLLEDQVKRASPGYETQFLNRAGKLCVDAGEPARALGYYGRAIDVYLESGRFNAAEVLCKTVLQIAPDAVRARCTLAWLSIGKG